MCISAQQVSPHVVEEQSTGTVGPMQFRSRILCLDLCELKDILILLDIQFHILSNENIERLSIT